MEFGRGDLVSPRAEVPVVEGEIVTAIRELADRGWGSKAIARELGVARNTVRRYRRAPTVRAGHQTRPPRRLLDADRRVHGTTHETPRDRFVRAEHAALRPLPARPLPRREQRLRRRFAHDAFVDVETVRYSVSTRRTAATCLRPDRARRLGCCGVSDLRVGTAWYWHRCLHSAVRGRFRWRRQHRR